MKNDTQKEDDFDQMQEELIREDQKEKEGEMPVSGKSVFDIQRLKNRKNKKSSDNDE